MKKLFIHIGLPKTGSSAIQSTLSLNHQLLLAECGLAYADLVPKAKEGRITSGNAKPLVPMLCGVNAQTAAPDDFRRQFEQVYFNSSDVALISGEGLAKASAQALRWFSEYCIQRNIDVEVVAYIRNIYDHCWSAYQQRVKKGGYADEFGSYAQLYQNPQVQYIRKWSKFFSKISLLHFDSVKSDLLSSFFTTIGCGNVLDTLERVEVVNRSMTMHELQLLLRLNGYASEMGLQFRGLLSDALIYANPAAKSCFLYDEGVHKLFVDKFSIDIEWIQQTFPQCSAFAVIDAQNQKSRNAVQVQIPGEVEVLFKALLRRTAMLKRQSIESETI